MLREGVADYATCSTVTAWITTLSDLDVLLPGTQLCAVTTDDRFAGLAVTEVTPDTVTFEVTTWETPSS